MGNTSPGRFEIKDCAQTAIATGKRATNLRELRDALQTIHPGCIYYHFWGALLWPRFENPEYLNDFAEWARHGLHDQRLAERLAVIDPAEFPDLEMLRQELLDVIEERLDETEMVPWARRDEHFHFVRSQLVVFDTNRSLEHPEELAEVLPQMTVSSVFYHFIDARRRTKDAVDDFREWLATYGDRHARLIHSIAEVDPYFTTLHDLRAQLSELFQRHLGGKR